MSGFDGRRECELETSILDSSNVPAQDVVAPWMHSIRQCVAKFRAGRVEKTERRELRDRQVRRRSPQRIQRTREGHHLQPVSAVAGDRQAEQRQEPGSQCFGVPRTVVASDGRRPLHGRRQVSGRAGA